jgi:formate dehydrogenase gamma subunit
MAAQTEMRRERFRRWTASQRTEHWLMMITFTGLAITGLPQKWATAGWAESMIGAMGGIETVRVLHRIFATGLMAVSIVHIISTAYRMYVLGRYPSMLPRFRDVIDMFQKFAYNLGMRDKPPKMPRFNYEEKFEYWALVWGTLVMIITGFMLWNPIATTHFLPGEVIPAAKAAHGNEAFLAVAAIIIWHMYNVHIRHFNRSMFTGWIDRRTMEEEHALELEDLEAGRGPQPPSEPVFRRRMRVFVPLAAVLAIALTVGLYFFVTFEKTAITTLPAP